MRHPQPRTLIQINASQQDTVLSLQIIQITSPTKGFPLCPIKQFSHICMRAIPIVIS